MNLSTVFKKAMIDMDIKGAKQLSEIAGISYEKTLRILAGDTSVRLKDAVIIATALGYELKAMIK